MNVLFLMVGISGSGKSVFSENLSKILNIPRVSSDEIRIEVCNGDVTDQSKNGLVFKLLHERIDNALKTQSVIADATNVKAADRKALRQIALKNAAKVVAIIMNTDINDAKKFNNLRDRNVPDFVIDKQFNAMVLPSLDEVSEVWYVNWQEKLVLVQRPNQFEFENTTTEHILDLYAKLS